MNEFSTLLHMGGCKSGLIKMIPLICSTIEGQYPVLSHARYIIRGACHGWLLEGGHPVSILHFLRAHHQGSRDVMVWWLWHPLFTYMTANTFSLTKGSWPSAHFFGMKPCLTTFLHCDMVHFLSLSFLCVCVCVCVCVWVWFSFSLLLWVSWFNVLMIVSIS